MFFTTSPNSIITVLRDCRDTAPRRSREAGQRSNTFAREEVRRSQGACARRPAVQGHRAGAGLDDLSRHLRRDGKVSLGDDALDRDRLDPLPGVRDDHDAAAMMPGSPLYALPTNRLGLHLMRGAALLGSSLFFISGLRFLPIAEASATGFVAPLFVTALSIIFLGEKVGLRRWIATAVGLIGVLIILRPGTGAFHPAAFFPLVSALAWACTLIMTRMMSGTERAITTMTYSSIAGLLILSALVPFVWVTPTWHDIAFGILIGVASTAGQWIVVLAFRYADASVLAPFSYTQLLWVSVLGYLIFGEVPDAYTITGAAFIVASGLYTAHRERVRRSQLLAVPGEPSPNA